MSKAKTRPSQSSAGGIYKPESIRDVAESIGITSLNESVASTLASDVEYRIHQVVEAASRFMRHARRTTLTTTDIDLALRTLNIEPLYGHSPHNPPIFRRAGALPPTGGSSSASAVGAVYFVEDEEIEFDRVLREDKVALPKPMSWSAHWLAVEGVQPLVPENPPAVPRESAGGEPAARKLEGGKKQQQLQQQQLVKQVLSRELQLYYARLTGSLIGEDGEDSKRIAALASLRHDAGLQALLPYLVRWVAEGVVGMLKMDEASHTEGDGRSLEVYLDVISALLDNTTLFVEPYLHQLLPPILSILLHSALPRSHAHHLRTTASQTVAHLLTQHATTYPSLAPRIMKTLLLALVAPGRSAGTREGAVRGLSAVGKEAVRTGVLAGGGAKVVGAECSHGAPGGAVDAVMEALNVLHPPSSMPIALRPDDPEDAAIYSQLKETVGDLFATRLARDAGQARGILIGSDA